MKKVIMIALIGIIVMSGCSKEDDQVEPEFCWECLENYTDPNTGLTTYGQKSVYCGWTECEAEFFQQMETSGAWKTVCWKQQ